MKRGHSGIVQSAKKDHVKGYSPQWINGKTVLITGATRGLGRALAQVCCSANGVRLILHGRDRRQIRNLEKEFGDRVLTSVAAELGKRSGWKKVESAILRHEPDILILNAGRSSGKKLTSDWSIDEAWESLTVNLVTPILLARAFCKLPRKNEPRRLVLVLSTSCLFPRARMGPYVAAKFGLMGFGKVMQQETEELFVRTLLIYPGRMNTSFRKEPRPEYTNPLTAAEAIIDLLSLPNDIIPYEFVFRPPLDTTI